MGRQSSKFETLLFTPHVPLSNPLTAEDSGSSASIDVSSFLIATSIRTFSVHGGSISELAYQTRYNIYFDELGFATRRDPFDPIYQASTAEIRWVRAGRFFVGSIITPVKGAPPTSGNGDGGNPHFSEGNDSFKLQIQSRYVKPADSQPFTYSDDYRTIVLYGTQYVLTSQQAQIIQRLYNAYEKGTPEIGSHTILENIGTPSSRLRDSFKSNLEAWRALVRTGKRKGTVRLNI